MYGNLPVFLINRDDRQDRLLTSFKNLSKNNLSSNITRIEACKPNEAEQMRYKYLKLEAYDNIISNKKKNNLVIPSWGALGCAISHRRAWETIKKYSLEYALIVEDDLEFKNDKYKYLINEGIDTIVKNNIIPMCILFGSKCYNMELVHEQNENL